MIQISKNKTIRKNLAVIIWKNLNKYDIIKQWRIILVITDYCEGGAKNPLKGHICEVSCLCAGPAKLACE